MRDESCVACERYYLVIVAVAEVPTWTQRPTARILKPLVVIPGRDLFRASGGKENLARREASMQSDRGHRGAVAEGRLKAGAPRGL